MRNLDKLLLTPVAIVAAASGAHAQAAAVVDFDIPAGDLGGALNRFGQQSGAQIVFSSDLTRGQRAAAVRGRLVPALALDRLLSSSGLSYRVNADGIYVICRVARERASDAPATRLTPKSIAAETEQVGLGEDIVVTARKRQESVLNVPVIAQVLPADRLERLQITEMADLPRLAPGLNMSRAILSIGTLVSIRGVGTNANDAGVDQSVSLNIDGLPLGNGLAFSSGLFDVAQVEVLKGPQALFYGKSSPGGVIALRTADPIDRAEFLARVGYGLVADNPRVELVASGPISDTLKVRLAGAYERSDGYFRNVALAAPGTGALNPRYRHDPRIENYMVRGTVLWTPTPDITAKLKVNIVRDRAISGEGSQRTSCPEGNGPVGATGIPFILGDDCKMNRSRATVYLDPASFTRIFNGGVPFVDVDQEYGTLDLRHQIGGGLTLSSTTGYYRAFSKSLLNASQSSYAGPLIAAQNTYRRRSFTEEVRLDGEFDGPIDFTLGAFFEDGRFSNHATVIGNTALKFPAIVTDGTVPVDIKAYSAFGQLRWTIADRLELAGGLRWTDEKRSQAPFNIAANAPIVVPVLAIRSRNVAPEATLTYRATDDLTLFAALKQGYKSGSFTVATPPGTGMNNSFGDERVRGGEVGLKGRVADRQLQFNVAAYSYWFKGLQVGARTPITDQVPRILTLNAGAAKTWGLDFDAAYRPHGIEGLALNAAVNWNRGRYTRFNNAPCYGGQLPSDGCDQLFNNTVNVFTAQDLSGTPLVRAPKWGISFGIEYELHMGRGYRLVLTNNNQYSSRYTTFPAVGRPNDDNYQAAFAKVDLGAALRAPEDRWEIAVIGKNVTDKLTTGGCTPANQAQGTVVANPSGGAARGPAGFDEVSCNINPGREVWLRLTLRPFGSR